MHLDVRSGQPQRHDGSRLTSSWKRCLPAGHWSSNPVDRTRSSFQTRAPIRARSPPNATRSESFAVRNDCSAAATKIASSRPSRGRPLQNARPRYGLVTARRQASHVDARADRVHSANPRARSPSEDLFFPFCCAGRRRTRRLAVQGVNRRACRCRRPTRCSDDGAARRGGPLRGTSARTGHRSHVRAGCA